MVGNYGVPNPDRMDEIGLPKGFESDKIHASALIVQDYSETYSHWNAKMSLGDWLKREVWKILPRKLPKCVNLIIDSLLFFDIGNSWPHWS